jgi:hypothetical protein
VDYRGETHKYHRNEPSLLTIPSLKRTALLMNRARFFRKQFLSSTTMLAFIGMLTSELPTMI